MEASGANFKMVPCLYGGGEHSEAEVLSSRQTIQINDLVFDRLQLLFALGVNSGDLKELENYGV